MVDFCDGLYLIPFVGNKIRPPDTNRGRGSGGCGLIGAHRLAGGQEDTSRPLPVYKKHINCRLMPEQIGDMEKLKDKVEGKIASSPTIEVARFHCAEYIQTHNEI